jgi:predicted Zn-dependent protease
MMWVRADTAVGCDVRWTAAMPGDIQEKNLIKKWRLALIPSAFAAISFFHLSAAAPLSPISSPGASGAWTTSTLPRLGEAGGIDLAEELRLGERIAQQIYRDPDHIDDPVLGDYLQTLWQPLLASARARGDLPPDLWERFAWELLLVRDRTVNAFALPGGYFGIHLGLLATVGNADELASVLAHEMSHVTQRHITRVIARQGQQSTWMTGAMILGVLAASAARNADLAQAAVVGSQAVAVQNQLNFSRDMEREADRVGYGVMTDAGFDGHGFVSMFERLQQASKLSDDGSFPYLRSHPLTSERMADMKARVQQAQPPAVAAAGAPALQRPSATWHALMSARARVLAETDSVRWQDWVDQAQRSVGRTGSLTQVPVDALVAEATVRASGALAAVRLKRWPDAMRLAQTLLALPQPDDPTRETVANLVLEIALQPGAAAALAAAAADETLAQAKANGVSLKGLLPLLPELGAQALRSPHRAALMLGAQAAQQQGQAAQASDRLQLWVSQHPRDALAWMSLSQAWQAQGQPLRAVRAEAQARVAQFDVDGALDRLRAAQEMARKSLDLDPMEQSVIDTMRRDLLQRQRELAHEKPL